MSRLKALDSAPDVLILQCMYNNINFCIDEDGCLNLPRKYNGRHHIEGELKVASREQVINMIKYLEQLIGAVPTAKVILITSFPRTA